MWFVLGICTFTLPVFINTASVFLIIVTLYSIIRVTVLPMVAATRLATEVVFADRVRNADSLRDKIGAVTRATLMPTDLDMVLVSDPAVADTALRVREAILSFVILATSIVVAERVRASSFNLVMLPTSAVPADSVLNRLSARLSVPIVGLMPVSVFA